MRAYMWVLLLIVGMMGAYIALLPLTTSADVNSSLSMAAPG
jgi:hypothetical protein